MYPVLSGGFKLNFDGSSKCLLGFLKEEQGGSTMAGVSTNLSCPRGLLTEKEV